MTSLVDLMGRTVDLDLIENPHLRRAIRERLGDFLFFYRDHTDHSEYGDHTEKYSEKYGDYYDHTDSNKRHDDDGNPVEEVRGHWKKDRNVGVRKYSDEWYDY